MAETPGGEGRLQVAQATEGGGGAGAAPPAGGANGAPLAANDCAVTAEDADIRIAVLANDLDPDGDALNLLSASQPANGTATVNPDGSISFSAGEPGLETIRYQIGDGQGGTDAADVAIFINPAPDASVRPVLAGLDEQTLSDIARACVDATALDTVSLDGQRAVVESIAPGQRYHIEAVAGQEVELRDPAFRDASYFVVEGGLLVITNDGRMVYLADFVQAADAAAPVSLAVANGPAVAGDVLLAGLQPIVVPAEGQGGPLVATVPPPDAGPTHGGGAGFQPYDPGDLPPGFDPTGPLA
ncbi:MAG TPA: Ig-like domain-containing protein, partial [Geminicoccaceae bacterium]